MLFATPPAIYFVRSQRVGNCALDGNAPTLFWLRLGNNKGKLVRFRQDCRSLAGPHRGGGFVTNRARNIAAFNYNVGHDEYRSCLIYSVSPDHFRILPDFSQRVQSACESQDKEFVGGREEDSWVEKIVGDQVTVGSRSRGEAEFTVVVRVSPAGRVHLLRYSRTDWPKTSVSQTEGEFWRSLGPVYYSTRASR